MPRSSLLLVVLLAPLAAAQTSGAAAPRLPGAALAADVDLLQQALEALHPGLYRSATPAEVSERLAALRRQLAGGATLTEAFLALSRFTATVRCGHTFLNPVNQSRAVQEALFAHAPRVPFDFRWLGRRMVITRDRTPGRSLAPGTEVLAIDGRPVSAVLEALLPLARADGANDAKRVAVLELQGDERWPAFDVFYPLLFPPRSGRFELEVRPPGARVPRRVTVAALTTPRHLQAAEPPSKDAPAFTLDFPWPDLAVLRMPTWALYDSPWDWRRFLDQTFEALAARGTPALVLDVRGNEGGLSVGDEVLAHLVERDLRGVEVVRLVRYRQVPEALRPFLDTWDRSFLDWGDGALPWPSRPGFFRLTRYDDPAGGDVVHPRAPRFQGKVAVLVGAANSSATFELARQVQASGLGLLVGQPTGGNLRGINGGAFFFLRLPGSGLEVDLPLIGQFPPGPAPDSGLVPDVLVSPGLDDVARGLDPELTAARRALLPADDGGR